jgi:hypothetical protein
MDEFEEADAGGELAQAIQGEHENLNLRRLSGSSYVQAWNEITARADQSFETTQTR